jgi:hypothetical protein
VTGEPHGGDKASGTDGPDEAALENGRLLFAGACDFIAAANNMKVLPPEGLPEICFRRQIECRQVIADQCADRAQDTGTYITDAGPHAAADLLFAGGSHSAG